MSISVQVVNTSWGGSTSAQIADLGRRLSALEAARTVIEAGTITAGTIAAGSITSTEIATGTITASDIATGTITATQIAANTITASQIAANTITAGQIAAGTITATQIAAGSITTGNIAAGAITSALIAAGAINAGHIQANSIDTTHIAANTILAGDIAAATITSTQIAAQTILAGNIAAHTITATQIAAGTITATEILAGTITATQIASHTITAAVIAAGTITSSEIASATITGGLIAGGTITATNIASGTITSTQLAANSVTSAQIISGAVDATKISVSNLAAISANLGTITAGSITGATVQTAASGARVVLNTGGINAYNAAGTPVLAFDSSTGNLTLTGTVNANASSVISVGSLTGGQIGSGNLLSDGGMEDTTLSNWVAFSNVTAIASNNANARSGARSLRITAGTNFNATALADAPTYYWRLGETSGTTAASSTGTNNGTYTGGFTLNQASLVGDANPAILLNGSTGEVTTAVDVVPNSLGDMAISVSFKTTTASGGGLIGIQDVATGGSSQHDRMVWMANDGKVKFGVWIGSALVIASTASYNDGARHIVHAVLEANNNMKLYVDGTLVASNANTTAPAAYTGTVTGYVRMGNVGSFSGWDAGVTSTFFNGTIDEAMFWNSAITAGQAAAEASAASGGLSQLRYLNAVKADAPTLYLRLNETTGVTALNAMASGTYLSKVMALNPVFHWRLNETAGTNIYAYPNTGGNFATIVAGLPTPGQWLRLDETSGTSAADASGNGRVGAYSNCTLNQTTIVQGDSGKSVALGASGAISTTYQPFVSGTKRTFAGFATPTAAIGNPSRIITGGQMYLRFEGGGSIRLSKQNQAWSGTWGVAPAMASGVPFHWAVVVDETVAGSAGGGTAELFINGVSQGVLNPSLQWGTNGNLQWNGAGSEQFAANYDEVMVFEDALTLAQIKQLAAFALGGTYSGITLNQNGLVPGDADKAVLMPNSGTMHSGFQLFSGTETRTIMVLANRASTASTDTLWGMTSNNGCVLWALAGTNDIQFASNTGANTTWTNALAGVGVTKHVTLVANDAAHTVELFIDGVSQGSRSVTGAYGSNPISLGSNTGASQWNGTLDEFTVFNGALTPTQIADVASNALAGTYGTGITLNQTGATGDGDKAVSFNNTTNATVTTNLVPFNGVTTGLTLEGIFKRTATTDTDALFQTSGGTRVYLRLDASSNDVRFDANNVAGTSVTWANAWPGTGTFVHWALTFNRTTNTAELFINGVSKGTVGSIEAYGADPGWLIVGDNSAGIAGLTNGVMDEFAVYPTILSSTQIASHAAGVPLATDYEASASIVNAVTALARVQGNQPFTAAAYFKAATVGRKVRTHIRWHDSGGSFISQSSSVDTSTVSNTSTWTRAAFTATAPSNAAFARVLAEVVGVATLNELHYIDDVALVQGLIAADEPSIPQNTIIGNMIIADQITAREIAASSITSVEIAAATITAGNIAANTITAGQIAAGTITTTQLSATAIDSMTITGATVRTNANAQFNQVIMDSTGLRAYGDKLVGPPITSLIAGTGIGGLASGTYYYKITAINGNGESTGGTESSVAVTGPTGYTTLSWNAVPGATKYRVYYGTAAGAENLYQELTITGDYIEYPALGITHTSSAGWTAGSPPGTNTAITVPINVTTSGVGTITGATYRTSETGIRLELDRAGINMYDSSNVRTGRWTSAGGLVMSPTTDSSSLPNSGRIRFVDASAVEKAYFDYTGMVGRAYGTSAGGFTLKAFAASGLPVGGDAGASYIYGSGQLSTTDLSSQGYVRVLTGTAVSPSRLISRNILTSEGDSHFAINVYVGQVSLAANSGNQTAFSNLMSNYPAGLYHVLVYMTGPNRVNMQGAMVLKPWETNVTPAIGAGTTGTYAASGSVSIQDMLGNQGGVHTLVTINQDGIKIVVNNQSVATQCYVRIIRLNALSQGQAGGSWYNNVTNYNGP